MRMLWVGVALSASLIVGVEQAQSDQRPLRATDLDAIRRIEWTHTTTAFVPARTRSGTPLHWAGTCVFLRPHLVEPLDVAPGELQNALELATSAWQAAASGCGYLRFELEPPEAGEVGLDFVNRIVVREDRWCRPDSPICYDASAIAITTLFFIDKPGDPSDGTIVDADIELNAVTYALGTCDDGCTSSGVGQIADLANTLTHELGHLIGLDHTCWPGAPQDAPRDGDGEPVPSCQPVESLPAAVREATMYPFSAAEEIDKRTPEPDDVAGFCRSYPRAMDPAICAPVIPPEMPADGAVDEPEPVAGGCCRAARGDLGGLLVLVVLARRRRRAR
jgi:hypothetical protein